MVRRHQGALVDARNVTIEDYRECNKWRRTRSFHAITRALQWNSCSFSFQAHSEQ